MLSMIVLRGASTAQPASHAPRFGRYFALRRSRCVSRSSIAVFLCDG